MRPPLINENLINHETMIMINNRINCYDIRAVKHLCCYEKINFRAVTGTLLHARPQHTTALLIIFYTCTSHCMLFLIHYLLWVRIFQGICDAQNEWFPKLYVLGSRSISTIRIIQFCINMAAFYLHVQQCAGWFRFLSFTLLWPQCSLASITFWPSRAASRVSKLPQILRFNQALNLCLHCVL